MSDRTLTCRDCGNEFVFTAGEQDFYTSRGFSEPQRCPSCRQARKSQRNNAGGDSYGGGYSSNDSYGGGYGNRSERGFSGGGGGQRTLYPATCSECGKQTEVPFNPSPGKPVYCRECFQNHRASSNRYDNY
ncbi:MAG: zinc-ribbon domain containing protein [Thermomicrobiales bacterium]|nr:zinc-ribbon domain containing protein [Thermomicrobiales bacterium]